MLRPVIKPATATCDHSFKRYRPELTYALFASMDFYYSIISPPCQSVLLVARKLGITLNLKKTNVHDPAERDALTKLNPQHTIPTLVDNGHVVWESYAIVLYLVEKYGKDDKLYPKDPKVRSVINQRLFFDIGTLYKSIIAVVGPIVRKEQPSDELKEKMKQAVDLMELFVSKRSYAAADHLTVADLCLVGSINALSWMKYDLAAYPGIKAWMAKVAAEVPHYAEVRKEADEATKEYMATRQ